MVKRSHRPWQDEPRGDLGAGEVVQVCFHFVCLAFKVSLCVCRFGSHVPTPKFIYFNIKLG